MADPLAHYSPQQLLNTALAHPRLFAPGTRWSYSNTDYVLAGLLIQAVTGHSYGAEIDRRIIEPLGLHDTSGAMISSGTDMNRFLGALPQGRLLLPAELRAISTPAAPLRRMLTSKPP